MFAILPSEYKFQFDEDCAKKQGDGSGAGPSVYRPVSEPSMPKPSTSRGVSIMSCHFDSPCLILVSIMSQVKRVPNVQCALPTDQDVQNVRVSLDHSAYIYITIDQFYACRKSHFFCQSSNWIQLISTPMTKNQATELGKKMPTDGPS